MRIHPVMPLAIAPRELAEAGIFVLRSILWARAGAAWAAVDLRMP